MIQIPQQIPWVLFAFCLSIAALISVLAWNAPDPADANTTSKPATSPSVAVIQKEPLTSCLNVVEASPNNARKQVIIVIQNTCSYAVPGFTASFKLYDGMEARIGWITIVYEGLSAGEKVRWDEDYPIKDYPLTDMGTGVSKVVLDKYVWSSE